MSTTYRGPISWSRTDNEEGHRDYKIVFRVVSDDKNDGPQQVKDTPGLPLPGAVWAYGNDFDPWAWCRNSGTVTAVQPKEGDPTFVWNVEYLFSSKPGKKCQDEQVEDPLLEPVKISIGGKGYQEEATHDRYGQPIVNSAFEQIRGPQNEWEMSNPVVKFSYNLPNYDTALHAWMRNKVNDSVLWGLPPRTIKLTEASAEQKYHGTCEKYWTVNLEFEIKFDGWDRDILDEGTKVISGQWSRTHHGWERKAIAGGTLNPDASGNYNPALPTNPDPNNPAHFIRFKDRRNENTRIIFTSDQTGMPWVPDDDVQAAAVTQSWWCVTNGVLHLVIQATCEDAKRRAIAAGAGLKGPYGTEAEAQAICTSANDDEDDRETYDPRNVECDAPATTGSNNGPGYVHVEKYLGVNFLLLGIPTTW